MDTKESLLGLQLRYCFLPSRSINALIVAEHSAKNYNRFNVKEVTWTGLKVVPSRLGTTQCAVLCHAQKENCNTFSYDELEKTCSFGKVR